MAEEQNLVDEHESVQTSASFVHPHLTGNNAFRLLRIMPAKPHQLSIQCEMFPASFDKRARQYIAGSYVWGPPKPTFPILVNGCVVYVRENLSRFLRACRTRWSRPMLWIDALCINQDNIAERNSQVRGMNQIYLNAKAIYCWLGHGEEVTQCLRICIRAHKQKIMRSGQTHMDDRVSASVQVIAESEYFTRMWIVQEFLLGRERYFLAGTQMIPYKHLEELLGLRTTESDDTEEMENHLNTLTLNKYWPREFQNSQRKHLAKALKFQAAAEEKSKQELQLRMGWSQLKASNSSRWFHLHDFAARKVDWALEELFERFGGMSCSVPQDKIFALLGLCEVRAGVELVTELVDYNLGVWQLLHRILRPITYPTYPTGKKNFGSVHDFAFTHTYAQYVIMDAKDGYMETCIDFDLTECRVECDSHPTCYCLNSGSSVNLPHFCLRTYSAFPTRRKGEFPYPMKEYVDMFQYSLHMCQPQPYRPLKLPSVRRCTRGSRETTVALIQHCNDDCYRRDRWDGSRILDCKGHSIVGFGKIPGVNTNFEQAPWFRNSKVDATGEVLLLRTVHDQLSLHKRMVNQTLPSALSDFEKTVRVLAMEGYYKLVISLEMLVRFVRLLKELDEVFELEIKPYGNMVKYTYYSDEKEVIC